MLGPCEARRGAVDLMTAFVSAVRTGRAGRGEEEDGEELGEEAGGMMLGGILA